MSEPALTDADYKLLAEFRATLRRFMAFSEARAAEAGITPQQHQALLAIRAAEVGTVTIGNVADWLLLKPHSASGLIDRLEVAGLLERRVSQSDRRQAHVVLTDRANTLLAQLSITHREEIRRLGPMLGDLINRIEE